MAAIVEGTNLTKRFGTGDATVVAIDAVDIAIQASELVMIMGDSGCGKTTLISLLGCILTPDEGELRIDGETICQDAQDMSQIRCEKIGFVFPTVPSFALSHRTRKRDGCDGHCANKHRGGRDPGARIVNTSWVSRTLLSSSRAVVWRRETARLLCARPRQPSENHLRR